MLLNQPNSGYQVVWSGKAFEQDVTVLFETEKNRVKYSASQSETIDREWRVREETAVSEGRHLYNSSIFRLSAFNEGSDGQLVLELGLTDYREYVATRSSEKVIPRANPIGTCIIPVTTDGYIPVGRRSQFAEVNPGKYFSFGGFFDAELDILRNRPNVFSCIRREVREELGLELNHTEIQLIAIIKDLANIHPELAFHAEIGVSCEEVRALDWSSELSDLTFVHVTDIMKFLDRSREEMTPTFIGALQVFMANSSLAYAEKAATY
ncbi:hypothetical protein [Flexibacterium corallicola]|uniref:hypothetical protein n=1 Tax=Flexibacterium corallicola TaxID=3037259 RepID=UPI00286F3250|nr:hypothetical protein [Pseudovibrio sp. M1P-2-3]